MKKTLFVVKVVTLVAVCFLTGCASTTPAWKNDDVSSFSKGQTEASVIQRLGQPYRKYSDSNGVQVWEYRKPTESKSGSNAVIAIATFGMVAGKDSAYVDILRFRFKNHQVTNVETEENVSGVFMPGSRK